jgi:hypothetical protein
LTDRQRDNQRDRLRDDRTKLPLQQLPLYLRDPWDLPNRAREKDRERNKQRERQKETERHT